MQQKTCFRIDDEAPHLKASYRRLALVTDQRHVDLLGADDGDTLIVSSDWLLWQECLHKGLPCVLASRGIPGWGDWEEFGADYYMRTHDWLYVNGEDATLFRGVSLGRKFVRQVSLVIADYEIKTRALEVLTERFGPRQYIYFDYRTDDDFLDDGERFSIACSVAERFGIDVVDRRNRLAPVNAECSVYGLYKSPETGGNPGQDKAAQACLAVFEWVADGVSRLRRLLGRARPSVLLLNNQMTALPLIEKFDGAALYPMFLAKLFPHKKKLGFVGKSIASGILLISAPKRPLPDDDHRAVDAIHSRLEEAWKSPATGREALVRRHVREHILAPKLLYGKAVDVMWAERVLDRHKPDQIFTDALQNTTTTTFLEVARQRGIPAAATWHGPYIQDVKLEIFGCDPRLGPLVDRCFTWGKAHEDWLDNISAKTEKVRIGNLVCGLYRRLPPAAGKQGRALVLQYINPGHDFAAPTCHEYFYFVRTVRVLRDLGYSDIRFKFHPGLSKIPYYTRIAEFFDVECEMFAEGLFADFVAWADFVIGPATSGAMLEVISAGKPYYPVLLPPHSINVKYLEGSPVYTDLDALGRALAAGEVPDQRKLLNDFNSFDEIPDPAVRVWQVLRGEAASAPRPRRP
jgi:hypothetical protein